MSLTEKWKNGELPYGHYYVIFDKNDTPEISRCVSKVTNLSKPAVRDFEDFGVEKVLAPVPDYEELERLKAAKSNNRYFLNAIKDMKAALDYMTDENEKCEAKIKNLEKENAEHKENCCCLENEKLRLDLTHRDNELRQKVDYIHKLLEIKETYKKLLEECRPYINDNIKVQMSVGHYPQLEYGLLERINAALGESED